jgi:uncharacterized protein (TIGR03118 family)
MFKILPIIALASLPVVTSHVLADDHETVYKVTDLVANRAGVSRNPSVFIDPKLVNPWGIAFGGGPVWLADNGSASSTLYNGVGKPVTAFGTPANPTGMIYNGNAKFFQIPVAAGSTTLVGASFVFAHETGVISAWSGGLTNAASAVTVLPANPAVSYKGLALGANGTATFLYAADFQGNKVDVFDTTFKPATLSGRFIDPLLPAGYAPFGIQNVGGDIVVAYALQADSTGDEAHGAGLGRVDIFTADGVLSRRLHDVGSLNAPWGIALAPASFGSHAGELLIGNFGSGRIATFDLHNGEFKGYLRAGDAPIVIGGLWGISFGNGATLQATNTLYYTAGTNHEADGIYGRIDAVAETE